MLLDFPETVMLAFPFCQRPCRQNGNYNFAYNTYTVAPSHLIFEQDIDTCLVVTENSDIKNRSIGTVVTPRWTLTLPEAFNMNVQFLFISNGVFQYQQTF